MKREEVAERLPQDVQPKTDKNPVVVPVTLLSERTFTPEQISKLRQDVGLIDVNSRNMEVLPDLGHLATQLGVVSTIKGTTLISQEGLTKCMVWCQNVLDSDDPKIKMPQKREAARLIGYISGQLAKVNKSVVDVDATVATVRMEADKRHRNTFQPGHAVRRKTPVTPT